MDKNFLLRDSVALESETLYIDLHNFYDFKRVELLYTKDENSLELNFERNDEFNTIERNPKRVKLIFRNLQFLVFSSNYFLEFSPNVEEIGYKNPDDFDYDWLLNEEQKSQSSHLVIRFENGEYLRLFSLQIELSLKN